jgi:hypothetical protein
VNPDFISTELYSGAVNKVFIGRIIASVRNKYGLEEEE